MALTLFTSLAENIGGMGGVWGGGLGGCGGGGAAGRETCTGQHETTPLSHNFHTAYHSQHEFTLAIEKLIYQRAVVYSYLFTLAGNHLQPALPVMTALVGRGLLDPSEEVSGVWGLTLFKRQGVGERCGARPPEEARDGRAGRNPLPGACPPPSPPTPCPI